MKKILSVVMGCAMTVGVMAVPARRDGLVRTQSDGTQISHPTINLHLSTT